MYVEMLDGRFAGQMRDLDPGAARDLINLGRAKAYGVPTPANPQQPGGYSGTHSEPRPFAVVRLDEPTDKPLVAWDTADHKPVAMTSPAKAKNRR